MRVTINLSDKTASLQKYERRYLFSQEYKSTENKGTVPYFRKSGRAMLSWSTCAYVYFSKVSEDFCGRPILQEKQVVFIEC